MCRCVDVEHCWNVLKLDVEIVNVSWCCAKLLPKFFVDVDVPKFFRRCSEDVESVGSVGSVGSVKVVWLHFKASQVCWTSHCRFFRSLSPFLKFFLWEPWSDLQPSECRFNSLAGVTNPKLPANVFPYLKQNPDVTNTGHNVISDFSYLFLLSASSLRYTLRWKCRYHLHRTTCTTCTVKVSLLLCTVVKVLSVAICCITCCCSTVVAVLLQLTVVLQPSLLRLLE